MDILVPIDGSDASERGLRFAADFSRRFEGSLSVVHITDAETEAAEKIVDSAREVLAEEGVEEEPSISIDVQLSFRTANRIGNDILDMVREEEYDHVIMGHHGGGTVDRLVLGSAAETVVRAGEIPVTVIP